MAHQKCVQRVKVAMVGSIDRVNAITVDFFEFFVYLRRQIYLYLISFLVFARAAKDKW